MTEDEEFELLAARLAAKQRVESMVVNQDAHNAVLEAQRFIEAHKNDLGIMTLRKAFEMGYNLGYVRGQKK